MLQQMNMINGAKINLASDCSMVLGGCERSASAVMVTTALMMVQAPLPIVGFGPCPPPDKSISIWDGNWYGNLTIATGACTCNTAAQISRGSLEVWSACTPNFCNSALGVTGFTRFNIFGSIGPSKSTVTAVSDASSNPAFPEATVTTATLDGTKKELHLFVETRNGSGSRFAAVLARTVSPWEGQWAGVLNYPPGPSSGGGTQIQVSLAIAGSSFRSLSVTAGNDPSGTPSPSTYGEGMMTFNDQAGTTDTLFTVLRQGAKNVALPGTAQHGIYSFQLDTLIVATSYPGIPTRPPSIEAPGGNATRVVLKRVVV
jgi:hypothetical protein